MIIMMLIPGVEIHFPADQLELFLLGFRQVVRFLKKGATVLVMGVQKGKKEVIIEIVMPAGNDIRPGRRLEIEAAGAEVKQKRFEIPLDLLFEVSLEQPADALVDPVAVPPALHVGLPETEAFFFQHTGVKTIIPHLDVPWIGAVDPDARFGKQLLDDFPVRVHMITSPIWIGTDSWQFPPL
jgi:hypothetical protein